MRKFFLLWLTITGMALTSVSAPAQMFNRDTKVDPKITEGDTACSIVTALALIGPEYDAGDKVMIERRAQGPKWIRLCSEQAEVSTCTTAIAFLRENKNPVPKELVCRGPKTLLLVPK